MNTLHQRFLIQTYLAFVILIFSVSSCEKDDFQNVNLDEDYVYMRGSTAYLQGILIDYGESLQEYGFVYSYVANVSIDIAEKAPCFNLSSDGYFSCKIDSLNPENICYVKAYAIYSNGDVIYSSEKSLTPKNFTYKGFTPTSGKPGQVIKLKGNNFGNFASKYSVLFGETMAEITGVYEDSILVKVPMFEADSEVRITISDGSASDKTSDYFTYILHEQFTDNSLKNLPGLIFQVNNTNYLIYHYNDFYVCDNEQLFTYNPSSSRWTGSFTMPYYRHGRVVVAGNTAYFLNLENCSNNSFDYEIKAFRSYNFDNKQWSRLELPDEAMEMDLSMYFTTYEENKHENYNQLNVLNNTIYLSHARKGSINKTMHKYSIESNQWVKLNDCPIDGAVFTADNALYLVDANTMYRYNAGSDSWQDLAISDLPATTFYYYTILEVKDYIYFIDYHSGKIWKFDPSKTSWSEYTQLPLKWRAGAAWYNGEEIIVSHGLRMNSNRIDSYFFKVYHYCPVKLRVE